MGMRRPHRLARTPQELAKRHARLAARTDDQELEEGSHQRGELGRLELPCGAEGEQRDIVAAADAGEECVHERGSHNEAAYRLDAGEISKLSKTDPSRGRATACVSAVRWAGGERENGSLSGVAPTI